MKIDRTFFEDLDAVPFVRNGDLMQDGRIFNSSVSRLLDKYDAMVFYDTETTGLNAQGIDELGQPLQIIELAAVRVEKENGEPKAVAGMDEFIKMNNDGHMPPSIIEFNEKHQTGITDELIASEGIPEREAVKMFDDLTKGNVLMVAYNAQFDMCFVHEMLQRSGVGPQRDIIHAKDCLDPLTVFKDRKPFFVDARLNGTELPQAWNDVTQKMEEALPQGHKLEMAVAYYSVDSYVKNSHRAIDDVKAMFAATRKMDEQRADLDSYVGVIGVNPKYGLSGIKHPNIAYCEQTFIDRNEAYPRLPNATLPSVMANVDAKFPDDISMSGLATQISIELVDFKRELYAKENSTYADLDMAKVTNQSMYYINKKRDALVKRDQFPAFMKIKGDAINYSNEFAKKLMAGNEQTVADTKAFLKEVRETMWVSPAVKLTAERLDVKLDSLVKELQLAPALKLNKDFEMPKEMLKEKPVADINIARPIQSNADMFR